MPLPLAGDDAQSHSSMSVSLSGYASAMSIASALFDEADPQYMVYVWVIKDCKTCDSLANDDSPFYRCIYIPKISAGTPQIPPLVQV